MSRARHHCAWRAVPADRRAQPEQHVAGEDDALPRQVDEQVARGVGRSDPEQLDPRAVQVELEPVVDQRRRRSQLDAGEVPIGEQAGHVGHGGIGAVGGAAQRLHHLWALAHELLGAQTVPDDLGIGEELVAPAVVAVAMRVDDTLRRALPDSGVLRDHVARVRQVPEGVDHHTAAVVTSPEFEVPRPFSSCRQA